MIAKGLQLLCFGSSFAELGTEDLADFSIIISSPWHPCEAFQGKDYCIYFIVMEAGVERERGSPGSREQMVGPPGSWSRLLTEEPTPLPAPLCRVADL